MRPEAFIQVTIGKYVCYLRTEAEDIVVERTLKELGQAIVRYDS